jgi:hypothetical protein
MRAAATGSGMLLAKVGAAAAAAAAAAIDEPLGHRWRHCPAPHQCSRGSPQALQRLPSRMSSSCPLLMGQAPASTHSCSLVLQHNPSSQRGRQDSACVRAPAAPQSWRRCLLQHLRLPSPPISQVSLLGAPAAAPAAAQPDLQRMHAQQTVPEASGAWQAAAGRAADVMVPQVQQERDAASAAAQQQLRQLQQERDAARAQLVSARQAADDSMHSADAASLWLLPGSGSWPLSEAGGTRWRPSWAEGEAGGGRRGCG